MRAGKEKVQAKSFAIPGIEPGVIVEYRYSETDQERFGRRRTPRLSARYSDERVSILRPSIRRKMSLSFNSYNMDDLRFVEEKSGFSVGTMTDVPAFKEEPFMPPDDESRKFVFFTYRASDRSSNGLPSARLGKRY